MGRLTTSELNDAEYAIFMCLQRETYSKTLDDIQHNRPLSNKNPLKKMNPFIDELGLLRVGGRLHHSAVPYESKHPIILPKHSCVTMSIVTAAHKQLGHMGRETMVAFLRKKYWIAGLNSIIRKLLYACTNCRRLNARPYKQLMAPLPFERVTSEEPAFTRIGLDCFGPFDVVNGRKHEKRYGIVFTCLASRAIHLEILYSLSTDSFINSFRRFMARRGNVRVVRCDNGTNIVGGKNEFQKAIDEWNTAATADWMLQRNIDWKFQPPSASHFGGIFEREIRSVRKVLRATMIEQPLRLSDEHLCTLFCEIESILNCRPLGEGYLSDDDFEAITPNHLLLLHAGATYPPGLFSVHDVYATRRWRQIQFLANVFWKRWREQYIPILQQRQKWFSDGYQYKVGDLVLLTDQLLPRNQWSLGRVLEVLPDSHGTVRVVKIKVCKYKTSRIDKKSFGVIELIRPVSKLILIQSHIAKDN